MTYEEAMAELEERYARGELDADEYEAEMYGIQYAYGEMMGAEQ